MITKDLILRIFSAANILRWNDHIRPLNFYELDKQAHKMIIAYIIAKFEEEDGKLINWIKLIEGGIFEFFQRIMLTDLKPEIFHEIMSKKEKELNKWVIKNLSDDLSALKENFDERCTKYLLESNYAAYEKKILKAAHCLSTKWEFDIIYPWNSMIYDIEKTKQKIEYSVNAFDDLVGVRKLIISKKYYGFLDLCGQLRFQQRWSHAFRIPKTNVLGHMLTVAIFAYILSLEIETSDKGRFNNFYSSLFHDLPEILTKDIIKPVKTSISGLEDIIKHYEKRHINNKILPLIPLNWHLEMRYFVEDEFSDKIIDDGNIKKVANAMNFNYNKYNAINGSLIKVCDKLCAYIEVSIALEYGIRSLILAKSKDTLYNEYSNTKKDNLDFKQLFDYFH
ncbi:MAG: HD domain-containing protein [Endomicrobium sp.]|jgi:putative hydrolase of HD superfamily|nr:HD domain-containing protein [Endomicrobium sp.]